MPPKKSKVTATASVSQIGNTRSTRSKQDISATGTVAKTIIRKRGIAAAESESPTSKRTKTNSKDKPAQSESVDGAKASQPAVKRGRGRPRKKVDETISVNGGNGEQQSEPVPKRSGRPPKAGKTEEVREEADFDDADEEEHVVEEETEAKPVARKRGRPSKAVKSEEVRETADFDDADLDDDEAGPPKKRCRPKKQSAAEDVEEAQPSAKKRGRPAKAAPAETTQPPKKRGRPPKAAVANHTEHEHEAPAKKRGRPRKTVTAAQPEVESLLAPKKRGRPPKAASGAVGKLETKRPRGRPPKRIAQSDKINTDEEEDEEEADTSNEINPTEATTEIAPSEASGRQYWLMKAEPESRLEKTVSGKSVDVKFSIDDLAARSSPEPWDGIRNAVASNNMKAMAPGDLAFFYESNCKIPGIVGIMEIVKEADVDQSAFDQESAYYDAKSNPDKPRWMNAYVEFRRKFDKVSLKVLQSHGQKGGALDGMDLLRLSRLSVSRVSASQWAFIMSLVDQDGAHARQEPMSGVTPKDKAKARAPAQSAKSTAKRGRPASTSKAESKATTTVDPTKDEAEADFASAFEAPPTLSSSPAKTAASRITGVVEEAAEDVLTNVAAGIAHNLGDQRDIEMVDITHSHSHNHSHDAIETIAKDASVASPSLADVEDRNHGPASDFEVSSIKTRTPAPEDAQPGILESLKSAIGLSPSKKDRLSPARPSDSATRERSRTQTSTQTLDETFVTADTASGAQVSHDAFDDGDETIGEVFADIGDALARPLSYS